MAETVLRTDLYSEGAFANTIDAEKLLYQIEYLRLTATQELENERRRTFGQFFTPTHIARFMASMLECSERPVHILDAGAGIGVLFATVVATLCQRPNPPQSIHITAYEIDPILTHYAQQTLQLCQAFCATRGITCSGEIIQADFIEDAILTWQGTLFESKTFLTNITCVIMNPPYHKMASASRHRKLLRLVGIETSNLYTGFLAMAMQLLAPDGELISITPRSFCNGLYFRPFRQMLLSTMQLRRLHTFDSRKEAFNGDDVLQENVILSAVKHVHARKTIIISSGQDSTDEMIAERTVPYAQVVRPDDPQRFIHLVADTLDQHIAQQMASLPATLQDLNIQVSTGRVVDFRARTYLRQQPDEQTVPLIYPVNCENGHVRWPKLGKKPQALLQHENTQKLLVPNKHYVLVNRFTAKEEAKRVRATLYDAHQIAAAWVGFENHLNYFHASGKALDINIARGLATFLNSTMVDNYVRQFNGHTQVNATDLRALRYPSREQLRQLGEKIGEGLSDQRAIDALIQEELFGMAETPEIDPIRAKQRIEETRQILRALEFPTPQQNERSALTLLALLNVQPDTSWSAASNPLRGITPMMEFFARYYGKTYAPNSRETVRRQTIHQFLDAGLILINPDNPNRPTNSGDTVYQITAEALALIQSIGTNQWEHQLETYKATIGTLKEHYAQERLMSRIPIQIAPGKIITLSPGGQNILVEQILSEFAERFTPGGTLFYVGDTDEKFAYLQREELALLGVDIEPHGKMPDVIIHLAEKNWLVLIEAVTSHGPIDAKRKSELERLFATAQARLVFVTAFLSCTVMARWLNELAWETEAWVADDPSHMIHMNGEKFLGSSNDSSEKL